MTLSNVTACIAVAESDRADAKRIGLFVEGGAKNYGVTIIAGPLTGSGDYRDKSEPCAAFIVNGAEADVHELVDWLADHARQYWGQESVGFIAVTVGDGPNAWRDTCVFGSL